MGRLLVITGGAGLVGRVLTEGLAGTYDIVTLDLVRPARGRWVRADITRLDEVEAALADADAVVHLAGNPSPAASWESALQVDVAGTYTLFEAARRQRLRRVVVASSHHVMALYYLEGTAPIPEGWPPRPDSFHGWSKAAVELLGRLYAEQHGVTAVCLRLGYISPDNSPDGAGPLGRRMWLSWRDLVQVVGRALDADLRFGVYNATSANRDPLFALEAARRDLDFHPVDGA